jgi:hypothetical protein
MWNMKCFVVPVFIAATAIVSKSIQNISAKKIPGLYSIGSLQKTSILGTSHSIRKVLQAETWSLSDGVHHWLKRRSTRQERITVTRHNNNCNNQLHLLGLVTYSNWEVFPNYESIPHLVRLPGRGMCPSQGFYLHWTTKHRRGHSTLERDSNPKYQYQRPSSMT